MKKARVAPLARRSNTHGHNGDVAASVVHGDIMADPILTALLLHSPLQVMDLMENNPHHRQPTRKRESRVPLMSPLETSQTLMNPPTLTAAHTVVVSDVVVDDTAAVVALVASVDRALSVDHLV